MRGKNPGAILGAGWQEKASCDPDLIRGWIERDKPTGIGVYLPASGLVVIDVDDPALRVVAERLGVSFNRGVVAQSGRGGYHVYYRLPREWTAERWGNPRINGIEVRANGQQVLPPSRHPSGDVYAWLHHDADVEELPTMVVAARRKRPREGRREPARQTAQGRQEGDPRPHPHARPDRRQGVLQR